MKNKILSFVGIRAGGRHMNVPEITRKSPGNHAVITRFWKVITMILFLFTFAIGNVWGAVSKKDNPTSTFTCGTTTATNSLTFNKVSTNTDTILFSAWQVYNSSVTWASYGGAWTSTSSSSYYKPCKLWQDATGSTDGNKQLNNLYGSNNVLKNNGVGVLYLKVTNCTAFLCTARRNSGTLTFRAHNIADADDSKDVTDTYTGSSVSKKVLTGLSASATYIISMSCSGNAGNDIFAEMGFVYPATPSCQEPAAPTISGTTSYTEGETITLEASHTGTNHSATTTYAWYKGGTFPTASVVQAAATGAAGYTFTKTAALGDNNTTYWCEAANGTCKSHNETGKTITVSEAGAVESNIIYTETKGATNTNPAKYTEGTGIASFEPLGDVANFHFTGWSPASISDEATGEQTIEAQWVAAYDVTFSAGTGSGTVPATFQKWASAKFNLPGQGSMVAPANTVFDGWKVGETKYAANAEYTMGSAAVEFVAQWKPVIKLVLQEGENYSLNSTDFVFNTNTKLQNDAYIVEGVSYAKNVKLGGTSSSLTGVEASKFIAYHTKTNSTHVSIAFYDAYSSNTTHHAYVARVKEGNGTPEIEDISIVTGTKRDYLKEYDLTGRTSLYIYVGNDNARVCQVTVSEEGSTTYTDAPAVGYSVNLNKGRMFAAAGTATAFEGLTYVVAEAYQPTNRTDARIKTKGTDYISFVVPTGQTRQLQLTTSNTNKYTVSKTKGDDQNQFTPTANTAKNWNLTAGTWYINPQGSNVQITNIAFAAAPAAKTVTFKDGTSTLDTKYVWSGDKVSALDPAPTKSGYRFVKWQLSGADYDFNTAVTADIVLDAVWQKTWTVTFDSDGGSDVAAATVDDGAKVTAPADPTKAGNDFAGWYGEGEGTVFDFNNAIDKDTTIVAHWTPLSNDASISALTYDGNAIDISSGTAFAYVLPYKTSYVAGKLVVTKSAESASVGEITYAAGVASFTVTAGDGVTTQDYTVTFSNGPKDLLCLMAADFGSSTTWAIDEAASYFEGTKVISSVTGNEATHEGKTAPKFQSDGYLGFTLTTEGAAFAQGDIVKVFATKAVDSNVDNKLYVYKATSGASDKQIAESEGALAKGWNEAILTSAGNDATGLYLCRKGQYTSWNPCVYSIAVYRSYPKPVLTAMTINGEDATIDGVNVSVEIPYNADLANLNIEKTFMSNDPSQTTGALVGASWVLSDEGTNTYRVTDKDGDYTDYIITLTRAAHYEAKIGDVGYPTLVEAVAAAVDGDVVKLMEDVNAGAGVMIAKADAKQITIDFGGYTYKAVSPAVGSAGTQNQAFHFEKGCEITLKNGTITSEGSVIKMLVQNYGDLTLEDITLDGSGLEGNHRYVMSNNCGDVVIGDGTTITAKAGDVAFDVCATNYYPEGVKVTVEAGATVNGIVEYDVWGSKPADNKAELAIEGGTLNITWNVESALAEDAKENLNVSGGTFSTPVPNDYCAEGFVPKDNGNNTYGVKPKEATCLIKGAVVGTDAAEVVVGYGEAVATGGVKGTSTYGDYTGYKLSSDGAYIKVELANGQFLAGDSVEVFITTAKSGKPIYVFSDKDGENLVGEGAANMVQGKNYVILTADADALYLCRQGSGTADGWNPNVAYMAVYRVAAPSMQSFKIGDVEGVISEANKTVAIELPYGTDVTALTPTIAYVVNGEAVAPATTVSPAGAQDFTNPVVYTITDKDGDATAYTVTVSLAAPSTDATLSALSQGGNAIDLVEDKYEYNVYLPENTTVVPELAATATKAALVQSVTISNAAAFVDYKAASTVTVVAQDGTTSLTYTVKFFVAHEILNLVDVTGNMKWDFSKDGLANNASVGTDVIMANVDGVVNNDDFHSDNIMVTANKQSGTKLQASMIKFHTTVPGSVIVKCANTGGKDHYRYLEVNGVQTELGSKNGTVQTYAEYVQAGDVVLTVTTADGGNMFNFTSVEFKVDKEASLARTDSWMAPGEMGTICIPQGAVAVGADIYTIVGREPQHGKVVMETIKHMKPGKPYMFVAQSDRIDFIVTDEAEASEPDNSGAMKGTFEEITLTGAELNDVYYFAGKALWSCVDLTETGLHVSANRAYVKLSEIDYLPNNSAPAPGRRRISMAVNGEQVATGMESIQPSEISVQKVMINGQLFILRGEKKYDVTGKLVK